jgi:hypothetical protein
VLAPPIACRRYQGSAISPAIGGGVFSPRLGDRVIKGPSRTASPPESVDAESDPYGHLLEGQE